MISRLDCDSLPLTYKLLESGMIITGCDYVSEPISCNLRKFRGHFIIMQHVIVNHENLIVMMTLHTHNHTMYILYKKVNQIIR